MPKEMYSLCGDQGLFSQQCVHKFYPECISWAESQGFNIAGYKPAARWEGFILTPHTPLCWYTSNWSAEPLATSIPSPLPWPVGPSQGRLIQHLATPSLKVTSDSVTRTRIPSFFWKSLKLLLLKHSSFMPTPSNFLTFHPCRFHRS